MQPGQAIQQTYTSGSPDFPGDTVGMTMSAGGPGALVSCMKCVGCGWSTTATPAKVVPPQDAREGFPHALPSTSNDQQEPKNG
jgi:hypothetical protein